MTEPTIYELSSPGRTGVTFPVCDVGDFPLPKSLVRSNLLLPELSESDVVRHFTHLSTMNYSVDGGFYPLGSCTMKYNPRVNEVAARLTGFSNTHPLQPIETVQGNLALMYHLQEWLKEISGFSAVSLQPAAGAQGEFVGVSIIRAYHANRNDAKRNKMIIPDSAHGTNPASSAMEGFEVVTIATDKDGNIDLDLLRRICDDTISGLMLTNPNTLGLFDQNLIEVIETVHKSGGLVYGDGANLNALLGIVKPGKLGFDIMHFNLHKTFSTPHGGGGPGSGPVGVTKELSEYLPDPVITIVEQGTDDIPPLYGFHKPEKSIGRVKSFNGQFGMLVRAFTYISMHGPEGLKSIAEHAVLNANYLLAKIRGTYTLPYKRVCMHEFVVEGKFPDAPSIIALDIAKRLMDYNFHPPTNYFPLIVHEALMIEPTETESKQTLDAFAEALLKIADEAILHPELLKDAPHLTPIGRLDEVKAAKELVLCCWIPEENEK
jgi:glycine dehydrogenase subunit 2